MAVTSRETRPQVEPASRFVHEFAVNDADVKACQQLRYRIFAEEMGAQIDGGPDKLDVDRFDAHCHHLIVRDTLNGRIIACTRLLTCEAAARTGGFYSSGEFEMDMIAALPDRKVEVGRTCVDAEFRSGAIISKLWQGLTVFITQHNYRYLFGCASIGLEDGGDQASAILDKIERRYMAPEAIQWRDAFGRYHDHQTQHGRTSAYRTAETKARQTGKVYRIVDGDGNLVDLFYP